MRQIYRKKGFQTYCVNCGDLIFTYTDDVFYGDPINWEFMAFNPGQEKVVGERLICNHCGVEYTI